MNIKRAKFGVAIDKLKKIMAGGLLVFGLSGQTQAQTQTKTSSGKQKTEVVTKKQTVTQTKKTNYNKIKLEKYSDIEKVFFLPLYKPPSS